MILIFAFLFFVILKKQNSYLSTEVNSHNQTKDEYLPVRGEGRAAKIQISEALNMQNCRFGVKFLCIWVSHSNAY